MNFFVVPFFTLVLARDLAQGKFLALNRTLEWTIDRKHVNNHVWADYDRNEIASSDSNGDREDSLMAHDQCRKDGQYSRSYCPKKPDCERASRHLPWKMKLCINRIPKPENRNEFYVKIMKCIPDWENCDKCMCGRLKGDRCKYDGTSPDDDRIDLSCDGDFSLSVDRSAYSIDANPDYYRTASKDGGQTESRKKRRCRSMFTRCYKKRGYRRKRCIRKTKRRCSK